MNLLGMIFIGILIVILLIIAYILSWMADFAKDMAKISHDLEQSRIKMLEEQFDYSEGEDD